MTTKSIAASACWLVAPVMLAALASCAQQSGQTPQIGQLIGGATKQVSSGAQPVGGFLPHPELLTPGSDGQPYLIYLSPSLQPSSYTSVMLEPVTIWTLPGSSLDSVSPDQRQILADTFTHDLGTALTKVCPITTLARPGTMRLRFALTDAFEPNAVISTVATYTPYASTAYSVASYVF
jgi:hypothetical protein